MPRSTLYFVFACILASTAHASSLVDASFELSSGNLPLNDPTSFGVWSGNGTRSVIAQDGVTPFDGSRMLQFVSATSNFIGSTSVGSELYQLFDLQSFSSAINSGMATASASSYYNRIAGDSQTDTEFRVSILFHSGTAASFNPNSPLSAEGTTIATDGDVSTWELASVSAVQIPAGSDYLAVQIRAIENVFNDPSVVEFDGHFADLVSLSITIPEPSSLVLLTLGSACMLMRRRAT